MRALIVGGTRGIGKATAEALTARGWEVDAVGRREFDIHCPPNDFMWPRGYFESLIFCAGDVWTLGRMAFDYPLMFWHLCQCEIVMHGGVIVAVSSVAAERPAKVNPHYAAAKAALESYARTVRYSALADKHGWSVEIVRFDLVETDMLRFLPPETMTGRKVISKEDAAAQILAVMGI